MRLISLDHIVLTVHDMDRACAFYREVLGLEEVVFGAGRKGFRFGMQKINLQLSEHAPLPKAGRETPGSADICLLVDNIEEAIEHLNANSVKIEEGPVYRTGARSPLLSIYVRDPDGNLIELAQPQNVVLGQHTD
ncbi:MULTISPECIES: VOC family protein [Pseudovibrio]|uniref:VOC family protein n=1 Tax=Stappiaceae TaxID=2821832 RepID=UPI002365EB16|nr:MULTISPECIES: VOC family protein [Pseudovibrio]MDD7908495.1 VOC family protein [Pseudovibrio exalbescens]MDX5592694.1 VOC family protein [Pseudovibrio sp. SPO723]